MHCRPLSPQVVEDWIHSESRSQVGLKVAYERHTHKRPRQRTKSIPKFSLHRETVKQKVFTWKFLHTATVLFEMWMKS